MSKINLLPSQKLCLTVEEAAAYSMLGENRLRKIIEEDYFRTGNYQVTFYYWKEKRMARNA